MMTEQTGSVTFSARVEKAISDLQGLHEILLSGDLDPHILTALRDTLNRVRNTAWAAQQYIAEQETGRDSTTVLSFLAGERIRAAYQLCHVLSDDLKRTDIQLQAGSLVQLYDILKVLTKHLEGAINKDG